MQLREFTFDEIVAASTDDIKVILEPIMEQMVLWDRVSREEIVKGAYDLNFGAENGRVTVNGYPIHPWFLTRILGWAIGVNITKRQFWRDNPELAAHALNLARYRWDTDREIRLVITNDELVTFHNLGYTVGTQLYHFERVVNDILIPATKVRGRQTQTLGLNSYVLDPAWTRVNLLYIPSATKMVRTPVLKGITGDANLLLTSNFLKGRSMANFYMWDLEFEGTINLEFNWAYRSPVTTPNTKQYMDKVDTYFSRRKKVAKSISDRTDKLIDEMWRTRPTKAWETAVMRSLKSGINMERRKIAYEAYESVAIRSGLRLLFAMTAQYKDAELEKRVKHEANVYLWFKSLREGTIKQYKPKGATSKGTIV